MKKILAPKDYSFKVTKYYTYSIVIRLFHKKQEAEIGRVRLEKLYHRCYATHSWLDDKYHNKGLGVLLYAKAIQWGIEQGYRVRSSGGSSNLAQRVWRGKSIQKWFNIKVKKSIDPHYDIFYPTAKKEVQKKKTHGNSRSSRQSR